MEPNTPPPSDFGNRTADGICECLNPACASHEALKNGMPCDEGEIILCGFCASEQVKRGPCKHLGERTKDTIQCTTCRGNVRIRLFECELHKRCSIKKPVGFQCCWNCPDHKEI